MQQHHYSYNSCPIILATVFTLAFYPQHSEAALFGRLATTPGGTDYQVYYDSILDISWAANARLITKHSFGIPANQIFGDEGKVNWNFANQWIIGMNFNNYLGFNNWRLPKTIDIGNNGCDFDNNGNFTYIGGDCGYNVDTSTSEMSHLYYETLGNLAYYDTNGNSPQSGWGLANTSQFANIQQTLYWSGTSSILNDGNSWSFNFGGGLQTTNLNFRHFAVWPVRDGDVATIDGDINLDGTLNFADILLAQQSMLGLTTLSNEQIKHGDFTPHPNGNGIIDSSDILVLIKLLFS